MAPITILTVTRTKIAACCKQIRMIQSVRTREKLFHLHVSYSLHTHHVKWDLSQHSMPDFHSEDKELEINKFIRKS